MRKHANPTTPVTVTSTAEAQRAQRERAKGERTLSESGFTGLKTIPLNPAPDRSPIGSGSKATYQVEDYRNGGDFPRVPAPAAVEHRFTYYVITYYFF